MARECLHEHHILVLGPWPQPNARFGAEFTKTLRTKNSGKLAIPKGNYPPFLQRAEHSQNLY